MPDPDSDLSFLLLMPEKFRGPVSFKAYGLSLESKLDGWDEILESLFENIVVSLGLLPKPPVPNLLLFPPSKFPKFVETGGSFEICPVALDCLEVFKAPDFFANGLKTFFLSFLAPNLGLLPKSAPPFGDKDELFELPFPGT